MEVIMPSWYKQLLIDNKLEEIDKDGIMKISVLN